METASHSHFLCLCLFSMALIRISCAENGEDEKFVPTKEWQEVKTGQHIPPGLHVKMDLQNGGKWAKLMDKEEDSQKQMSKSTSILVSQEQKDEDSTKDSHKVGLNKHTVEELKSALKKIKGEKTETIKKEEEIKSKFRSMDEIKAAFEELNLRQESDFEVMQKLLTRYRNKTSSFNSKLVALEDLEYYVHQVDNANDFVKMNGLATIAQALNSTSPEIRRGAAHVIGSAVQSNPAVKVEAIKLGILSTLVKLTSDSTQPLETRKKAVYAISALIRNFPTAQYFFSNAGGFSVLRMLFKEHGLQTLQLKSISLINDLMVEREEVEHLDNELEENKEKIRQYNLFSLPSVISDMGFCEVITTLLDTDAHDQRDTILSAMRNLNNVCNQETYYLTVSDFLRKFQGEYKNLLKIEEEEGDKDSFFHYMFNTVTGLLQKLDKNLSQSHSEL